MKNEKNNMIETYKKYEKRIKEKKEKQLSSEELYKLALGDAEKDKIEASKEPPYQKRKCKFCNKFSTKYLRRFWMDMLIGWECPHCHSSNTIGE